MPGKSAKSPDLMPFTDLRDTTAPAGAKRGPIMELSVAESLIVRRFMEMSLLDLEDQVQKASRDPSVGKRTFAQIRGGAELIAAWASDIVMAIDKDLQRVKLNDTGRPASGASQAEH